MRTFPARRLWRIIRHSATLPLLGAVAGLGCAAVVTVAMPPTYQADASVILSPRAPDGDTVKSFDAGLAQSLAPSVAGLVSSREVARMTAQSLGIDEHEVVGQLTGQSELGVQIVRVRGSAPTAARAAAIANAGADAVSRLSDRLHLGGAAAVSVGLLDSARIPTAPVYPRPLLNDALGALIGALAGLGLLELRRRFDDRVRRVADVETLTGLAVPGLLPLAGSQLALGGARLYRRPEVAAEMDTALSIIQATGPTPARHIVVTGVADAKSVAGVAGLLTAALRRRGAPATLVERHLAPAERQPLVPEQADSHHAQPAPTAGPGVLGGAAGRGVAAAVDQLSTVDIEYTVTAAPPVLAGGDLWRHSRDADAILLVVAVDDASRADVRRAAAVIRGIGVPAYALVVSGGSTVEDGWRAVPGPARR